jgi:hypothetical protein
MTELFQAAMASVNIFYTVLLMIVSLYWITVFVGLLDMKSLEIDIDADVDVDVDIEADIDTHVEVDKEIDINGGSHFGIGNILAFFQFW